MVHRQDSAGRETVVPSPCLGTRARIDEIACMLGGVNITDTTRQHATEIPRADVRGPESVEGGDQRGENEPAGQRVMM